MKLQVIVHKAAEGGYWAEVPTIPGCASQGETLKELHKNISEAIAGCLAVDDRQRKCSREEYPEKKADRKP